MTIKRIKKALADVITGAAITVGGKIVTAYPYVPDDLTDVSFFVGAIDIDASQDFSTDTDADTFSCYVMVPSTDAVAGQEALDALLDRKGPTSVRTLINGAAGEPGEYALGGACDDVYVQSVRNYHRYNFGTNGFYGAEIRVFTIGAGDGAE